VCVWDNLGEALLGKPIDVSKYPREELIYADGKHDAHRLTPAGCVNTV